MTPHKNLLPSNKHFTLISNTLLSTIQEAGTHAITIRNSGLQADIKSGKDDIVTQADLAVSALLQKFLIDQFPQIQIIDEESQQTFKAFPNLEKLTAIIDPIDGTTNFFNKNNNWGISIGFYESGKPVAGVIFQPELNKMFFAEDTKGAYLNGKKVTVSQTPSILHSICVYDVPYLKDKAEFETTKKLFAFLKQKCELQKIYRMGSQVIEVMELVQSQADFFFHLKTKPWDMAAAIAIIKEAGGKCFTAKGNSYRFFNENILITNGHLEISPFVEIMQELA